MDESKDAASASAAATSADAAGRGSTDRRATGADAAGEAEAAFEQLRRLYDRLPAMEERGALLARARAAAEAVRLEGELRTARVLLAEAKEREAAARAALDRAAGEGDGPRADERRRALLHAGSLRGFRVGPAQNAEAALARALEQGPFADAAQARAAALGEAELAALQAEVDAYRRDYAAALARCEALAEPADGA